MRWEQGRRSENVEDNRGSRGQKVMVGGGIGLIVILLLGLLFGADPARLLEMAGQAQQPGGGGAAGGGAQEVNPEEEKLADFVKVVLADTEDVWDEIFPQEFGRPYEKPVLRLFSNVEQTACGFGQAAMGPFYCPADKRVYIDLAFYNELKDRFHAPGDFAQAYVIAHEVGHHVQNLLGVSEQVQRERRRLSQEDFNELSVRLELQADFYAGVWAHHAQRARNILERGDIEEGLRAATAIGDDTIQKQAQGYVVPDSFTHGSAAQRVRWFRRGLQSGDVKQGDTFRASEL
jgi:predicted metalloprotease